MKNWFKNLFINRNQPKSNHEKNVFTNALPITDILASEREWIKIVPIGLFPIHHCGPHEVTAEHIEEMAENFSRSKTDLLFDYEHRSLWGESIAAGWSAEVEARDDGLYCKYPEFTNKATGHIAEKEYRYLSPVYKLDELDKEGRDIGAVLLSVGLTNTPYLDNEIDHIGNSATPAAQELETTTDTRTDMKLTKENLKKLGLEENATEEQINEAIANSQFDSPAVETEEEQAEEKDNQPKPNTGGFQASQEENERIKALEDRIAKKEQEELAEKAETLVNSAIDQGKILPRDKGAYLTFAKSNYDTAKEEIGKLKANSVSPGKMQVNENIDENETGKKKVNSTMALADYTKAKRAATA